MRNYTAHYVFGWKIDINLVMEKMGVSHVSEMHNFACFSYYEEKYGVKFLLVGDGYCPWDEPPEHKFHTYIALKHASTETQVKIDTYLPVDVAYYSELLDEFGISYEFPSTFLALDVN